MALVLFSPHPYSFRQPSDLCNVCTAPTLLPDAGPHRLAHTQPQARHRTDEQQRHQHADRDALFLGHVAPAPARAFGLAPAEEGRLGGVVRGLVVGSTVRLGDGGRGEAALFGVVVVVLLGEGGAVLL